MTEIAPLIGLPGRRKKGRQVGGLPGSFDEVDIDVYLADYGRGVAAAGGIALNIPLDVDIARIIGRLDGILFCGGSDFDPGAYGADNHPETEGVDLVRDSHEMDLYRSALENEVPVLGICRGLQLMNIVHGGTLHQHVPEHSRYDVANSARSHSIEIQPGSALDSLYGSSLEVNSLHHQTVDRLGDGLTVTARADDGVVEAVELNDHTIAVQWHPELLVERDQDPIFRWLVETAKKR